jgi:cytochrome c-type biogenesis protein CcmE
MKKTHLIALIAIALSIGVIISMVSESSSYQDFETARQYKGQEFYVVGDLVEDKPLTYNPEENPNHFSFYMEDKNGEVHKVVYNGAKPQDFERSEEIVLVGAMENGTFQARKLLLKCPSKYKEKEVAPDKTKAEL